MTPPIGDTHLHAGTEVADRLPLAGLLPLAMAGLITIMTELMPAGLLPQISAGLGVSPSAAGQTVTAYAAGSLLSAIPLMTLTQTMRRRWLLLLAIAGFALSNVLTAFSDLIELTLVARFFGGMAGGLVWALLAGFAKRMSPPQLVGRAIAITGVGAPLAYSLGIPAGTWLGTLFGWRFAFGSMSLVSLGLVCWILAKVPDFPGVAPTKRMTLGQVARLPGIAAILFVTFAFVVGHNMLYTYITPTLALSGITQRVDAVLLTFGLAGLIGVWIAGAGIDRHARPLMLADIVLFAVVLLAMTAWEAQPVIETILVAIWGLTLGAAPTIFQSASSKAAGDAVDVAQGIFVTAWNLGVAIGSLAGGALLSAFGVTCLPWGALVLLIPALIVGYRAKRHGFPGS
ncbi:MFS transporter [Xanthobacter agilis]|uniref:MFS transporter n=1 Tax=Xanthobacter agilis TaxID=47492 RepID=UPI003726B3E4